MIKTTLLNGITNERDKDYTALGISVINQGVISGLEVTSGQVAVGQAFIKVTRTAVTPNEEILVKVEVSSIESIDTTGTRKVWLEVNQNNINDPGLNDVLGTTATEIKTGASYPASNYIPLASIVSGVITDERQIATIKANNINGEYILLESDGNGEKILFKKVNGSLANLESNNIYAVTNIYIGGVGIDEPLGIPTLGADGKIKAEQINTPAVNVLKSSAIAGEAITQSDIDNGNNAMRQGAGTFILVQQLDKSLTDGIAYNTTTDYEKGQAIYHTGKLDGIIISIAKIGTGGNLVWNLEVFSDANFTNLLGSSNETITSANLTTSLVDTTFTFNNVVGTGIIYVKLNIISGTANTTNYTLVGLSALNANAYPLDRYIITQAGGVTANTNYDWYFKTISIESLNKVYKVDNSNVNKINFLGFATHPANIDENILLDITGISNTQNSLIPNKDYFVGEEYFDITNSSLIAQNTGYDSGWQGSRFSYGSITKQGQTFTTLTDKILRSIKLRLRKEGTRTDNVVVRVLSSDRNTIIGTSSNLLNGVNITGTYAEYTFNFDNLVLLSGVQYFIEVYADGGNGDSINYYEWAGVYNGNPYSGGESFYFNGSTWISCLVGTGQPSDHQFEIQMGNGKVRNITSNPKNNIFLVGRSITSTSIKIQDKTNIQPPQSKTSGVIYFADVPGFVNAYTGDSAAVLSGLIGPNNPPTITIAQAKQGKYGNVDERSHICFPVPKGYYYQVVNASVMYFTPNI